MRTYEGRFITHSKLTECCFCDAPINHIKKEKDGKILICKCGAEFIVFSEDFYKKIIENCAKSPAFFNASLRKRMQK